MMMMTMMMRFRGMRRRGKYRCVFKIRIDYDDYDNKNILAFRPYVHVIFCVECKTVCILIDL